ncbi:DUF488 family protein [Bathymodiolus thermophilus thioautotrophic gill symbiont]|uniref:DUF488 domain-containing protein n=1 Tax=Bathymodiolus thermophilus thioautotrophic gill symbiont TaxID=2360 RepID=A0A1J5UGF6_9GAMM|nr:DUF488 domain-containing protein [Bathymodiolus thermophilus thioautotrophic gill symbiont]OIR25005.1 hypothetical protein BGC33_05175 [Bathymodiolus thermophilus thioautotrophic gill symbiont]CAB5505234.1 hypothetical protein THERMOS_2090 [Bathymodiolus thermophilus thioautotrophic gill symbiont]
MNVFTIGFSQKSAEQFFKLLTENKVKKLIDIRLNNKSQLAGFANAKHLPYFLKLHNIEYEYKLELAPSKELLNGYKDKTISWEGYIKVYNKLLIDRNVLNDISIDDLDSIVLLCSEPTAEQCHRGLMAEYLVKHFENIKTRHL